MNTERTRHDGKVTATVLAQNPTQTLYVAQWGEGETNLTSCTTARFERDYA